MKRTTKFAVLATLTASLAGGAAFANHHKGERPGPRAERMFERLDADKDGKVTLEEMKAQAAARFAERDVDGDGVVSRDDRKAFRAAKRAERRGERFAKIDADGDGMISKEEFIQFVPERNRGERGERSERRGERGHHGHRMGGHRGHRDGERMHRRGGRGGPLTIQEAEARAAQRFERIDSDEKGYITLNDIKAFQADRREGRRNRHGE